MRWLCNSPWQPISEGLPTLKSIATSVPEKMLCHVCAASWEKPAHDHALNFFYVRALPFAYHTHPSKSLESPPVKIRIKDCIPLIDSLPTVTAVNTSLIVVSSLNLYLFALTSVRKYSLIHWQTSILLTHFQRSFIHFNILPLLFVQSALLCFDGDGVIIW